MFFFRHPRPVGDNRPVAMQVVSKKQSQEVNATLIIVEQKEPGSTTTNAENIAEESKDGDNDESLT